MCWSTQAIDVHSVCSPGGTEAPSPASTGESCSSSRRSPPSRSRLVSPLDVAKGTYAYIQGEMIGRGAYGCVYKALDSETGQIFVVKEVALDMGSKEDTSYRDRLMDELEICQNVSHKNVVSYLGHEHDDSHLRIFLEYVAGGPMSSVLREFGPLRGTLMKMATRGTLEGLNYLHSRSPPIVHRDIKGANVLVDLNFCVRLADFGCSKRDDMTASYTTVGSIPWMAPEVIQREGGHGRKADIWSLGCTLIEFASAERPWGNSKFDNNPVFAMWHIGGSDATPPIPDSATDDEHELISRCVQRSPDDRPWTEELLQMSFVA
jgi:serine/threonine protein kinase